MTYIPFITDRSHNRIVCLFSVTGDITCLNVLEFDNCPSVFVPYYDPDICVVFLTGKVTEHETMCDDAVLFRILLGYCQSILSVYFWDIASYIVWDIVRISIEYFMYYNA